MKMISGYDLSYASGFTPIMKQIRLLPIAVRSRSGSVTKLSPMILSSMILVQVVSAVVSSPIGVGEIQYSSE